MNLGKYSSGLNSITFLFIHFQGKSWSNGSNETLLWLKPTLLWPYKELSKMGPFELSWATVGLWPALSPWMGYLLEPASHQVCCTWRVTETQHVPGQYVIPWGLLLLLLGRAKASKVRISLTSDGNLSQVSWLALPISVCTHAPCHVLLQTWEKCCFFRFLSTLDIEVS